MTKQQKNTSENTRDATFYNKWAHGFLGEGCYHDLNVAPVTGPQRLGCSQCGKVFDVYTTLEDLHPNYCSDRNLSARVEEKIPKDRIEKYAKELVWMTDEGTYRTTEYGDLILEPEDLFKGITATTEQRIRAAYETMEKK